MISHSALLTKIPPTLISFFLNDYHCVFLFLHYCSRSRIFCSCLFCAPPLYHFYKVPWYTYDQKCDIFLSPPSSQVHQGKRSLFILSEKRETINFFFKLYYLPYVFDV